jgi:hypothetical protein
MRNKIRHIDVSDFGEPHWNQFRFYNKNPFFRYHYSLLIVNHWWVYWKNKIWKTFLVPLWNPGIRHQLNSYEQNMENACRSVSKCVGKIKNGWFWRRDTTLGNVQKMNSLTRHISAGPLPWKNSIKFQVIESPNFLSNLIFIEEFFNENF